MKTPPIAILKIAIRAYPLLRVYITEIIILIVTITVIPAVCLTH
jgi:hypothetical protein